MRPVLTPMLRAFEAWCLPPACLLCALPALPEPGLCVACRAEFRAPPPARHAALEGLGVEVRAAFAYDAASATLLTRYKFHGDLAAGRALAALALPALAEARRPDALVAVPLHRSRLRQRGHDQALGLARDWSRALGIPILDDTLHRERDTRPQTELDAAARAGNLHGAFRATRAVPAHVALVDDVLTTGSTLAAAAAALRAAGAREVQAWVVAAAG